jgi:hypothetical protein
MGSRDAPENGARLDIRPNFDVVDSVFGSGRISPTAEWSANFVIVYSNNRKCYYRLSLSNDNKRLSVEPKSAGVASQVECMQGDFVRRSDSNSSARQRTITFANGDAYDGEAAQGQPDGTGTYTWASGDKYIGSFADGKRNGQGTLYWGKKSAKGIGKTTS